jgi:protein-S-isoprenylcysteine O-methyltransferase Ste14
MGTFLPSFFSLENHREYLHGIVIQSAGNLLSIYALFCLGRSIGILPANRGIQTHGLYGWVRHPLYMSYQVANFGYVLNHPGLYNVLLLAGCLIAQVLRIYREEKFLDQDPQYQEYKKKVRWKLFPFVY